MREGGENQAARAPGATERVVPAEPAVRTPLPPATPANSSSEEEEEEESDGGQAPLRGGIPAPIATDRGGGRRAGARGGRGGARHRVISGGIYERRGAQASTTAAPAGTTAVPPEPSRKRKRGFSNLR
jgi:hypothetical protein